MIFKEEKRSEEVLRAKRARLKGPRKCTVGFALRYNCAETCRFYSWLGSFVPQGGLILATFKPTEWENNLGRLMYIMHKIVDFAIQD